MSANDKFDREFESFMNDENSRLAALYKKLPHPEPDAKLDAAVLAMAHRALNPELVAMPRKDMRRRPSRWVPAIGIAAGVVFAAGVAFRLGTQYQNERKDVGAASETGAVISVHPVDLPAAPPPPLLSPPPPPQEANALAHAERAAAGKGEPAAPAVSAPATTTSASLPLAARAKAATEQSADAAVAVGGLDKSAAASAPQQPQAFPGNAQARKRAPEMDAVERKQAIAAGAWQNLHDREVSDDEKRQAPAPAMQAEAAGAAPKPVAAPAPASAATVAKPADSLKEEQAKKRDVGAPLPPDQWIARIHELLRANHRDDALKSLAEFRKQYPKYRLPADLRDLQ